MITEYERKECDHPIIKEVLFWHDDAWLDGSQLEALLCISRRKFKRLLQQIGTETNDSSAHSEVFSVVRKRCCNGKATQGDWVYQIRYYDMTVLRLLAPHCDSASVSSFLQWLREQA